MVKDTEIIMYRRNDVVHVDLYPEVEYWIPETELQNIVKKANEEFIEELNKYLDSKYYRESDYGKSIISDLRCKLKQLSQE